MTDLQADARRSRALTLLKRPCVPTWRRWKITQDKSLAAGPLSKAGRTLGCYVDRPLDSDPGTSERALIEETSNKRDAVRHASRRREFGRRERRVQSPIASRFRYFKKPGAESE